MLRDANEVNSKTVFTSNRLNMELSFLPRSLWANDSKLLQHHVTDLFTSVHVTRDLPAGESFGPCVLQNTFYDTIAFIALKSCDKRNKSYVFRVDAEAMKSSPLVLSWLRLVQAASNKEEQNMEAYLRGGQLYFRSTRNIQKEEELLVWYDEELSHLLGFNEIKIRTLSKGFKCMKCSQAFKNEYPYLAHCRFLCAQVKNELHCPESQEQKTMEVKRQRRVTDFHNIARDLEHRKSSASEEASNLSPRKRRHDETCSPRVKKPVLLEKTNISNDTNITHSSREGQTVPELAASVMKLNADKYLFKKNLPECKQSAFTENWCAKCNLSFRMTSDLVFHMRSHHKKEFAAESQVRRRREEKLTCPICHEYFRERHHLSRHMTSHN
ncbi:hypothetical protein MATL_G00185440 [Megalops atlanticus]|uniref:PR domain zinc finger protein 8 n=1 Tax=Megalops atlanticus TaxID=7932 RepID=A0A9D3T642_MEGAT|nr:hypothetical protein MATL_G00185440 [Megalops atlanticus]